MVKKKTEEKKTKVTVKCAYPGSVDEKEKNMIIKTLNTGRRILKWDMGILVCVNGYVSWKKCINRGTCSKGRSTYCLVLPHTEFTAFSAAYMLYRSYMREEGIDKDMTEDDMEIKCYAFAVFIMEAVISRKGLERCDYIPNVFHCTEGNRGLFKYRDEKKVPYIVASEAEAFRKDFEKVRGA